MPCAKERIPGIFQNWKRALMGYYNRIKYSYGFTLYNIEIVRFIKRILKQVWKFNASNVHPFMRASNIWSRNGNRVINCTNQIPPTYGTFFF